MITRAMIFCAGLGTRFKPWTDKHPKALALVNGKSLLQRNIEYLQGFGIFNVVINVHHFADQIEEEVEKNRGWGSDILISDERAELLDTGGGLLKAKSLFEENQRFLTCNADILTNLHIAKLIEFHDQQEPLITVGITRRESSRSLLFDPAQRLCGWRNNKTGEEKIAIPSPSLHPFAYSCVALFDYSVFNLMQGYGFGKKFSLIDVYLKLAVDYPIVGFEHSKDHVVDVGKPDSIAIAEKLFP
ncbi:MAG: NDP-sugar synthase [Sphingomonadales bacterium]